MLKNKTEDYIQTSILDALSLTVEKKSVSSHFSKNMYQIAFVELCKLLIKDCITVDEYKDLLHTLLENYRKEFKK